MRAMETIGRTGSRAIRTGTSRALGSAAIFCLGALSIHGCSDAGRPPGIIEGVDAGVHDAGRSDTGLGQEAAGDAPHDVLQEAVATEAAPEGNGPPVCGPKIAFVTGGGTAPEGGIPSDGGLQIDATPDGPIDEAGSYCGTGQRYVCSGTDYQILCECPKGACTCSRSGNTVGTAPFAGCPSCDPPSDFGAVAQACGLPYN